MSGRASPPGAVLVVCVALAAAAVVRTGEAACYFSIELQGQFLMQSAVAQGGAGVGVGGAGGGAGAGGAGLAAGAAAASVRYSQVNITAEAIPIWGQCHRRLGSNVILLDSSGATSCFRCFHLALRSPNVLQVHTEGLDKCYLTEERARASCPNEAALRARAAHTTHAEIILYKTRDHQGQPVREQYCPISGHFSFTSRGGPGGGGGFGGGFGGGPRRDCPNAQMSQVDSCPSGSQLNMRYRNCNFPDFDVTYACLGHWEGPAGQRYLALLNRGADSLPRYPRYRCALFAEDASTGAVAMAFSSDSTCRSDLRNASWGFEALQLTPVAAQPWPDAADAAACRFPAWAQGRWQHLHVDGNTLVYRDHTNFRTYTARCVGGRAAPGEERFLVYARTQCGEQMYRCVWLKNRSANVLEFQMGMHTSSDLDPALCNDAHFRPKIWITQGRLERARETPCPVLGEYTGVIPDAQGLCARLASDCASPEAMFYAVSECTQAEVYEVVGSRWRGGGRGGSGGAGRRRGQRHTREATGSRIYRLRSLPTSTTTPAPTLAPATGPAPGPALGPAPAPATDFPEEYDPWTFGKTPAPRQRPPSPSPAHAPTPFARQPPAAADNASRPFHAQSYHPLSSPSRYTPPPYPPPTSPHTPFPQSPYSQTPYSQSPYFQTPHPHNSYSQPSYSQPPYSQNPYSQPPYPQNSYSQSSYPQPPYSSRPNPYTPHSQAPYSPSAPRWSGGQATGTSAGAGADAEAGAGTARGQSGHGNAWREPGAVYREHRGWQPPDPRGDAHAHVLADTDDTSRRRPYYFPGAATPVAPPAPAAPAPAPPPLPPERGRAHDPYGRGHAPQPSPLPTRPRPLPPLPSPGPGPGLRPGLRPAPGDADRLLDTPRRAPSPSPTPLQPQPLPPAAAAASGLPRASAASPVLSYGPRSVGAPRAPPPQPPPQPQPQPQSQPQRRRHPAAAAPSYREEREYRCLGQWEEGGLTYTYTQRRDVGTYECFVGSIVSGDEIYIKEAGEHCTRDANPLQFGMKLSRKGPCVGAPPGAFPPRSRPTAPWLSSKYAPEPTKPWKPVTAPPRAPGAGPGGAAGAGPRPLPTAAALLLPLSLLLLSLVRAVELALPRAL